MKLFDKIEKKINKCSSSVNLKNAPASRVQKAFISRPYPASKTPPEILAKITAKNADDYEASIKSTDPMAYTETHSTFDLISNLDTTTINSTERDSLPTHLSEMTFNTTCTFLERSYQEFPIPEDSTQCRPSTPVYFSQFDQQQTSLETFGPTLRSPSQVTGFKMPNSTSEPPSPFTGFELPGSTPSSLEVPMYPVAGQPRIPFLAYPEVLPHSPRAIVANRKAYAAHVVARRTQKRNLVTYNASEGPLEALYQLYELLLLDRLQEMQMAAKNFFYNYSWTIAEIQDPVDDPDRERYTVLGCMLHLLVKIFNENIAAGVYRDTPAHLFPGEKKALSEGTMKVKFETVPKWAQNVPPLDNLFVIPYCKYQDGESYYVVDDWADGRACPIFKTKRILLWAPNMNWRA